MRVWRNPNVLGAARWAGDELGNEAVMPFPAAVDPAQFTDGAGVPVVLSAQAKAGTNEQQTITINATGGTFKATFNGQQTGALAWNASADAVRDALEGLSSGGVGNFQVTLNTLVYTIVFINALGNQNVPAITTDPSSLTGGAGTAAVATTVAGAGGDTTLAITALSVIGAVVMLEPSTAPLIPAGSVLQFGAPGAGLYATTTADALPGDTSVAVQAIQKTIPNASQAIYSRYGRKALISGTVIGRTSGEAASNTPFGPADPSGNDDEVYLVVYDNPNIIDIADVELYRPGRVVYQQYLPQWTLLNTGPYTGLLAQIQAKYTLIAGQD